MILDAARRGLRRAGALWGLVLFLLAVNLLTAAVLAVPMALTLRAGPVQPRRRATTCCTRSTIPGGRRGRTPTRGRPSPRTSSAWASPSRTSTCSWGATCPPASSRGRDPERVRATPSRGHRLHRSSPSGRRTCCCRSSSAAACWHRSARPRPDWTVRGLLHASGFYFGRLLRLVLLVLVLDALLFWLYAPLARWADDQRARGRVRNARAMVWMLGRHLALLLALLAVSMVVVLCADAHRAGGASSAILAFLSAAALCLANFVADLRPRAPHGGTDGGRPLPVERARRGTGRRPATRRSSSPSCCSKGSCSCASSCAWPRSGGQVDAGAAPDRRRGGAGMSLALRPARRLRLLPAGPGPVRERGHRGHDPGRRGTSRSASR